MRCVHDVFNEEIKNCNSSICRDAYQELSNIWKNCKNLETMNSVDRYRFEILENLGIECSWLDKRS